MKKYLSKIAVFTLLAGVLVSCEEDKVIYNVDNGQALVGFNLVAANLKSFDPLEFTTPSEIIVEVGVSNRVDHDRAVHIVVNDELTTALPSQYTIDQSTLVIPAGEFTAKIKITSDYNLLPETDKIVLTLDLVSVDEQDILDANRDQFTLTIFRVCPREIPLTYTGYVTGEVGGATEEFTVVLTATADVATYTSGNLWGNFVSGATGQNYDGQYPYPGKLTINCDNTVDISGTQDYAPGGTGTFDPDTNEFQLYLDQSLFADPFTGDVFLTPVQ